jgi:hypothetical protein
MPTACITGVPPAISRKMTAVGSSGLGLVLLRLTLLLLVLLRLTLLSLVLLRLVLLSLVRLLAFSLSVR